MTEIEKIAFANAPEQEFIFRDAIDTPPFELTGFPWRKPGAPLRRLPEPLIADPGINSFAQAAGRCASGGVLRFRTDSRTLAIRAALLPQTAVSSIARHEWMPRDATEGFDLFERTGEGLRFRRCVIPPPEELSVGFTLPLLPPAQTEKTPRLREWMIYLPITSEVTRLEIGLEPAALPQPPSPLSRRKPIVFYGSSITQGIGVSRPGNTYPARVCRALDAPLINLGFAAGCKGELAIADAISKIDTDLFVLDYDHNADDLEHLAATHGPFFRRVRELRPDLAILVMSRGDSPDPAWTEVIRSTVDEARARGDRNVWFLDGAEHFADWDDPLEGTVDGVHPTDLGFWAMSRRVLTEIRGILA